MNLDQMTDTEFETYLKEKYGDNWFLVSLTPEEFARCPRTSPEEIKELLRQGREDRLRVEKLLHPPIIPNHIRFR